MGHRDLPCWVMPDPDKHTRLRVYGSPVLHRLGDTPVWMPPVFLTVCQIRFLWIDAVDWPKDDHRPPLPPCPDCKP